MGSYIYEPGVDRDTFWPEHGNIDDYFMIKWGQAIDDFFEHPDVQELANKNQWQEVFNLWYPTTIVYPKGQILDIFKKYNPNTFLPDVLAFFLYKYAKIDFMKYMDDNFVEKHFHKFDIHK